MICLHYYLYLALLAGKAMCIPNTMHGESVVVYQYMEFCSLRHVIERHTWKNLLKEKPEERFHIQTFMLD